MDKAEYYANRIIDDLDISPEDLFHLEEIAYQRGALVREASLSGAEARLTVVGNKAMITIPINQNPHRKRFSITHEIGHLELHSHKTKSFLCTNQDMNQWGNNAGDIEMEANEFAAALLLPERFFSELCLRDAPTFKFITELATKFDVSLTATSLRYLRFCNEPCAIVYSQDGYIRWFRRSRDFEDLGLFVNIREKVDEASIASSLLKGKQILRPCSVPLSAWVNTDEYRKNATVKEDSRLFSEFNAVLTLLWIDEEIEDDDLW